MKRKSDSIEVKQKELVKKLKTQDDGNKESSDVSSSSKDASDEEEAKNTKKEQEHDEVKATDKDTIKKDATEEPMDVDSSDKDTSKEIKKEKITPSRASAKKPIHSFFGMYRIQLKMLI